MRLWCPSYKGNLPDRRTYCSSFRNPSFPMGPWYGYVPTPNRWERYPTRQWRVSSAWSSDNGGPEIFAAGHLAGGEFEASDANWCCTLLCTSVCLWKTVHIFQSSSWMVYFRENANPKRMISWKILLQSSLLHGKSYKNGGFSWKIPIQKWMI